jgi:hypothetical protein
LLQSEVALGRSGLTLRRPSFSRDGITAAETSIRRQFFFSGQSSHDCLKQARPQTWQEYSAGGSVGLPDFEPQPKKEGQMKTKPTWTRYGKGVIMMGNYPPVKNMNGEGEEQALPKPKSKPSPKQG